MEDYKNLKRVACEELEKLNQAYENKHEFSEKDAELYKNLVKAKYYHTVLEEMEKGKERREMYDESYTPPRNHMGQFTSREMDPGYSGHYPPSWMYPRSYGMMPADSWDYRGRNW